MHSANYECILQIKNTFCKLRTHSANYKCILQIMNASSKFWMHSANYECILQIMNAFCKLWMHSANYECILQIINASAYYICILKIDSAVHSSNFKCILYAKRLQQIYKNKYMFYIIEWPLLAINAIVYCSHDFDEQRSRETIELVQVFHSLLVWPHNSSFSNI